MASESQHGGNTAKISANRMRLADRIKKIRDGIRVHLYNEYTEEKGQTVEVAEAEHEGKVVGRYVKKGDKVLETHGSHDAQESGAHKDAAKAHGIKEDEITYTVPTVAAKEMVEQDNDWGEGPEEVGSIGDDQVDTPHEPEEVKDTKLQPGESKEVKQGESVKTGNKPDNSLFKPAKGSSSESTGDEGDFKASSAKAPKTSESKNSGSDSKPDKSMSDMASQESGETQGGPELEKSYEIKAEPGKITYTKQKPEQAEAPTIKQEPVWKQRWKAKPEAEKRAFKQKLVQQRSDMAAGGVIRKSWRPFMESMKLEMEKLRKLDKDSHKDPKSSEHPALSSNADPAKRANAQAAKRAMSGQPKIKVTMDLGKADEDESPAIRMLRARMNKPKEMAPGSRDEKIRAALERQKGSNPYAEAGPGGGGQSGGGFPSKDSGESKGNIKKLFRNAFERDQHRRFGNDPLRQEAKERQAEAPKSESQLRHEANQEKRYDEDKRSPAERMLTRVRQARKKADESKLQENRDTVYRAAHGDETADHKLRHEALSGDVVSAERTPGTDYQVKYHGEDNGNHYFTSGSSKSRKGFVAQKNPAGKWEINHIPDHGWSWNSQGREGMPWSDLDTKQAAEMYREHHNNYGSKGAKAAATRIKQSGKFAEIVGKDAKSVSDYHPKDFEKPRITDANHWGRKENREVRVSGRYGPHSRSNYRFTHDPSSGKYYADPGIHSQNDEGYKQVFENVVKPHLASKYPDEEHSFAEGKPQGHLKVVKSLAKSSSMTRTGRPKRRYSSHEQLFDAAKKMSRMQMQKNAVAGYPPGDMSMTQPMAMSKAKELWQMTRKEYETKHGKAKKNTTVTGGHHPHASAVEIAANQGKPVPKEVMDDYPHLRKADPKVPKSHAEHVEAAAQDVRHMLHDRRQGKDAGVAADRHMKKAKGQSNPTGQAHNPQVRAVADSYAQSKGLKLNHDIPPATVDPQRASKIAQAYHEMPHNPNHPEVKEAYGALVGETMDQFNHILKGGLKVSKIEPGMENPYKGGSKDVFKDIKENNHLWYFPTEGGFGSGSEQTDHPLLSPVKGPGGEPMVANDVFRIVHDYFGHAKEGHGFGPKGEENAWRHHMQMYSPQAQKALTAETRGQNSWVNFGPHGEQNRKNPANTIYADQKAGILPPWAHET